MIGHATYNKAPKTGAELLVDCMELALLRSAVEKHIKSTYFDGYTLRGQDMLRDILKTLTEVEATR